MRGYEYPAFFREWASGELPCAKFCWEKSFHARGPPLNACFIRRLNNGRDITDSVAQSAAELRSSFIIRRLAQAEPGSPASSASNSGGDLDAIHSFRSHESFDPRCRHCSSPFLPPTPPVLQPRANNGGSALCAQPGYLSSENSRVSPTYADNSSRNQARSDKFVERAFLDRSKIKSGFGSCKSSFPSLCDYVRARARAARAATSSHVVVL